MTDLMQGEQTEQKTNQRQRAMWAIAALVAGLALLAGLLFAIYGNNDAGPSTVTINGQTYDVAAVNARHFKCVDGRTGYVAGVDGQIWHSFDAGKTWSTEGGALFC